MEPATAEEAFARLEDVQRVTEAALAYLDLDDLLTELLQRVTDILEADTAAVLLVEDDGRTLAARAAKGLEEEVEQGFRLPVGRGFAGRVAATREPVVIPDLDNSPVTVVNPLMREKNVRSLVGVPMIVEGKVIGVLHAGSLTLREFDAGDVQLLQLVADRVALSIERSRLAVQGQIAQTLQRSLLPRSLPRLPGLSMAAWYLPAAEETAVGGDWFDVIELGHRRLGLTIGDVAGHGMAAATHMGQLRSAVRAYALEIESPAELLGKVSRFADQEHSRMATVIYATLNLDTWVVDFARAGHPYPLLIRAEGPADLPDGCGRAAARHWRRWGLRPAAGHAGSRRDASVLHRWPDRAPGPDPFRGGGGFGRGRRSGAGRTGDALPLGHPAAHARASKFRTTSPSSPSERSASMTSSTSRFRPRPSSWRPSGI